MSLAASRKLVNTISILGICASIALTIYFINLGVFKDINALHGLVGDSLILGPAIFILLQILQVVIPIIPGGISSAAGVLILVLLLVSYTITLESPSAPSSFFYWVADMGSPLS